MTSDIARVVVTPLKKRSKAKSVHAKSKPGKTSITQSTPPCYEISSSSSINSSLSPPVVTSSYCASVRQDEIRQLHAMIQGYMESSKPHMICVTGPPGTGKTQTVSIILEGIRRGDYSTFEEVGVDDRDLVLYKSTSACFIQAFSINLQQANVKSSAEYQLAEYIVSCCIKRERFRMSFSNKLAKHASQADSILSCIPLLVSILPRYLVIGIDEIDRLFSIKLATSRRQTRLTRSMTPIHFLGELASKALEMRDAHIVLIGISNEEQIVYEMQAIRTYHECVHRLAFKPYNFLQLNTLVRLRHENSDTSKNVAVEYGTRKVASSTGDCRQILDMLTRLRLDARDPSETSPTRDMTEPAPEVTVDTVQKILGQTFQTDVARLVDLIETLTSQQQVIALAAAKLIVLEVNAQMNSSEVDRVWISLRSAQVAYRSFCRMISIQPFSSAGFRNAVDALVIAGLFDIKQEAVPRTVSAWSTPTKPPKSGSRGGLHKRARDTSVSRQRTPIKRRLEPLTPASPEFGGIAVQEAGSMAAVITLTVESSRVRLIIEKTQSRGVVKVFKLFTCPRIGEGSSDDDL